VARPKTGKAFTASVRDADYRALAEFRYHIRRYLDFSDQAARTAGLEPKQYQLLLALRGLPEAIDPTVGALAERLHIRHHSTVELINRAERNTLVARRRAGNHVMVGLTPQGRRLLARAVEERLKELRVAGPILVQTLQQLITGKRKQSKKRPKPSSR